MITFASDRDGDFDIYTMDADGSDVAHVTTNSGVADVDPDYWSRSVVGPSLSLLLVVGALLSATSVGLYVMVKRRV